jgi:hypothetical protein
MTIFGQDRAFVSMHAPCMKQSLWVCWSVAGVRPEKYAVQETRHDPALRALLVVERSERYSDTQRDARRRPVNSSHKNLNITYGIW